MTNRSGIKENGYKTAFKATSLFGGVQLFTILITILKSKVIALWLGAAGYGLMSLFSSAIQLIYSFSNLGLASSAVRDIARVNNPDNQVQLSKVITAIVRWIIATGILGTLVTVGLSPLLSRWFFSSNQYTISFILLSCIVLFMGLNEGLNSILQGTRHLSLLARANIYGSLIGLICALPLFYFFRLKGIVPAMIITAGLSSLITYSFVRKIKLIPQKQTFSLSFNLGLSTVKLGLIMAISSIALYSVEFIVKSFILKRGGVVDVGFYQAGWTLNAGYLGLVFSAMAKDYFPRLSQDSSNHKILNEQINEQAEIAILILCPLIVLMLVFLPLFIKLIYSNEFLSIVAMTRLFLIGSLIKAGSWAISFVFLAKGDGKTFLFNELGINSITLPNYLLCYDFWGLQGVGVAYILNYSIYFTWVAIVASKKYDFCYSKIFWKLFIIEILFTIVCICVNMFLVGYMTYIIGSFIFLFSLFYSLNELNNRMDIIGYMQKYKNRWGT